LGPFEISSSGELYRVGGLAGIGTDVANGTKVGVGAYVAYSELDLDAHYSAPAFAVEINTLDETVNTWSAGLAVLGESRHEVMRGIGLFFKGRAAALYANGELNAEQSGPFSAPHCLRTTTRKSSPALSKVRLGSISRLVQTRPFPSSAVRLGATMCSKSSIRSPGLVLRTTRALSACPHRADRPDRILGRRQGRVQFLSRGAVTYVLPPIADPVDLPRRPWESRQKSEPREGSPSWRGG